MTLTIELPDEQVAALELQAHVRGISAEQYARDVLAHNLAPEWLQRSWASTKQTGLNEISMDEIDEEIAAARKGIAESRLRSGS